MTEVAKERVHSYSYCSVPLSIFPRRVRLRCGHAVRHGPGRCHAPEAQTTGHLLCPGARHGYQRSRVQGSTSPRISFRDPVGSSQVQRGARFTEILQTDCVVTQIAYIEACSRRIFTSEGFPVTFVRDRGGFAILKIMTTRFKLATTDCK